MTFSGLEEIPCNCVKVLQSEALYKIIVYKEKLSILDSKTWKLKIVLTDDKTQAFVQPKEYEQEVTINF